jgi:D-alanyl-D-alanine carboxypeptidase
MRLRRTLSFPFFALLALVALLVLSAAVPALGEDDEDFFALDDGELLVEEYFDSDVPWDFPVALEDMDPELIRLANREYLLPKDFVPSDLVKVPSDPKKGGIRWAVTPTDGKLKGQYLLEPAAQALCAMNADMREIEGFRDMYLKSAYRSYQKQKTMYHNRLAKNKGRDDGWVSMEGASDHQTGLGCDVVPRNWKDKSMNDKMMKEPECQWMAEHCHEYGFIIRYPAGKEDVTGIHTEPWHLRYVGVPVATYIMRKGITLEEFHQELDAAVQEFLDAGGNPAVVAPFIKP